MSFGMPTLTPPIGLSWSLGWVKHFGISTVGVADLWDLVDHPKPLDLGIDRTRDITSQKTVFGQQLVNRRDQVVHRC